jgi:hypothetical protein
MELAHAARCVRRLSVTLLAAALLTVAASSAAANSGRSTEGDARAVLNAFGNGGWAVVQHSPTIMGAPAAGLLGSPTAIRPFPPFDGRHYCALDWHVFVIAWIDGGDMSFTRQNAEASLGQIVQRFWIDGAPVETERTPIKRFLRAEALGLEEAYSFQEGRILSPDDLTVGAHTMRVQSTDSTGAIFDNTITIHVDGAGTGACL